MDVTGPQRSRADAGSPRGACTVLGVSASRAGRHDPGAGVAAERKSRAAGRGHRASGAGTGRRRQGRMCARATRARALIRSPSVAVAVPAVVRLRRYVRVPYPAPPAVTRAGVLRRDSRRCVYCHGRGDTVDHVRAQESRRCAFVGELRRLLCAVQHPQGRSAAGRAGLVDAAVPGPPRRGAFGRLWSTEDADPAWEPWLPVAA